MNINNAPINLADLAKDFTSINEGKSLISDGNLTNFFSEILSKFDLPNLLSDQELNLDNLPINSENLSVANSDFLLNLLENNASSIESTKPLANYFLEPASLNELAESIQQIDGSYIALNFNSNEILFNDNREIFEEEPLENSNAQDLIFNNLETLSLPIEQNLNSDSSSDQQFRQTFEKTDLFKEKKLINSENDMPPLEKNLAQENEIASVNQSNQEVEISTIESNFEHIIKLLDKNDFKYSPLYASQSASKYETLENIYNLEDPILDQLKVHLSKLSPAENKIKVQLHPEELGSIEMEINFSDQTIKDLIIKVEKVDTYNLLQKDANELKSILSDLGFEFSNSNFSFNLESDQNQQSQQNQHKNPKRKLYESIDITNKLVENFLNIDGIGRIDITI